MKKVMSGLAKFQEETFPKNRDLFERLASGQSPETLFITCSDSRIDPCMLTLAKRRAAGPWIRSAHPRRPSTPRLFRGMASELSIC